MSVAYWRNGEPTEDGIVAFTEGDCWILAIRLHMITGWPVYLVDEGAHWLVREPGVDIYLDVLGLHSRSQVLRLWGARSLARADRIHPDLLEFAVADVVAGDLGDFPGSHQRAPVMASRLVDKYLEVVQ